jgi:hypothetical protein
MRIAIYDLGLRMEEKIEINTWKNVQLISFYITSYPVHVGRLDNRAWKPIVFKVEFFPIFLISQINAMF